MEPLVIIMISELKQEQIHLFKKLSNLLRKKEETQSKQYDAEIVSTKLRLYEIKNILRDLKEN